MTQDATTLPSVYSPLANNPSAFSSFAPSGGYGLYSNYAGNNNNNQGGGSGFNPTDFFPNSNPFSSSGNNSFGGFNPASGIKNAVNQFGTNFGLSPGTLSYTGMGPAALPWAQPGMIANPAMSGMEGVAQTAGSLSTASLSGVLGAAGIGAFAGGFLGKIGGSSTGGTVGGGLGAGIGMAVGGPVGAVIGGLVGGIGGGFFGSKSKPTSASEFSVGNLADWDNNIGFGSKNNSSGFNQQFAGELKDYVGSITKTLNMPLKGTIHAGFNSIWGGPGGGFIDIFNQDGQMQRFNFSPDDVNGKKAAVTNALTKLAQNSGATEAQITQMIKNLEKPPGTGTPLIKPAAASTGPSTFEQYVANYKSKQNANAAPAV